MPYKKTIHVLIDNNHAATITVDIKDNYATEIGTTSKIGDELDKFLTELIKKNSDKINLQ
jgi:hypothetical protein